MIFRDSRDLEYIKNWPYADKSKALIFKEIKGRLVPHKPSLVRQVMSFIKHKFRK